jgi:hypothetical protein
MRSSMCLPLVGTTLLAAATARAVSGGLLLERSINGICDVLPEKWSYKGWSVHQPDLSLRD